MNSQEREGIRTPLLIFCRDALVTKPPGLTYRDDSGIYVSTEKYIILMKSLFEAMLKIKLKGILLHANTF